MTLQQPCNCSRTQSTDGVIADMAYDRNALREFFAKRAPKP
jgi:hypothetical protein